MDLPVTFQEWAKRKQYPQSHILYNWTRPGEIRDRMTKAGVIARVNGRWLFYPARWADYRGEQS